MDGVSVKFMRAHAGPVEVSELDRTDYKISILVKGDPEGELPIYGDFEEVISTYLKSVKKKKFITLKDLADDILSCLKEEFIHFDIGSISVRITPAGFGFYGVERVWIEDIEEVD